MGCSPERLGGNGEGQSRDAGGRIGGKRIAKRAEADQVSGMSDPVARRSIRLVLSVLTLVLASLFWACQERSSEIPSPETPAETAPGTDAPPTPAETPATPTSAPVTEPKTDAPETAKPQDAMKEANNAAAPGKKQEVITLGGGCFWCVEAVMKRLDGVQSVVSGYMGGHVENPTYEQVCTKTTGHAEVVQVTFDPSVITLDEILDVFWQAHDPTTLNRQGNDVGPQYRSVIFYHSPEQRNVAVQSMKRLDESKAYDSPAVTEIAEASTFWKAEDYHQDYYDLNKDSNPYCRLVISPKLKKLGME